MDTGNRHNEQDQDRLEGLERLLRSHGPLPLSENFERSVMQSISALPEPRYSAPRSWRDLLYVLALLSPAEKAAAALIAIALCGLFVPGSAELLTVWSYELEGTELSLSVGESAFSASLLSLIALGFAAAFIAGVGAYSRKNHLLGA